MADQYHFNADQKKQLAELLDEKYRSLWSSVLYGIGTGDGEIVTIALSQLGNVGGSLTGAGTASHRVWSGALALSAGARMSAAILMRE